MMNDEIEAVARAIARARRSTWPKSPEPDGGAASEQHRDLARLAIATLEQYRAAKAGAGNKLACGGPEQPPAGCPDAD